MTRLAILLCAGYGTRMRELGESVPKPLLPIAGRPMLDYLLYSVRRLDGIASVEVVTNARFAPAFAAWAEERTRPELPIHVHDDGTTTPETRLGAVGDLAFVLRRTGIPDGGALVSAGDNIFLFDIVPFWQAFVENCNSRLLALEERDLATLRSTGVLELDGDRVLKLAEKPAEPASTWACPSTYALSPQALASVDAYLEAGHGRDEIGRFVGWLVDNGAVEASRVVGERLHVGNPEELAQAEELLRARAAFA
jgi:NDP-sugar pyrophosphorylase family protein